MPDAEGMVTKHEIKMAIGNALRFDRDLIVGWDMTPSIGLVAKDLFRMAEELESFREPLTKSIMMVMIPSFRKNFEQGGRPKWQELAPYTLYVKGQLGITDGDLPLHRTGALKRAVTQFRIWDVSDKAAAIRALPSHVTYGYIHQAGYGGFGVYVDQAQKELGENARPFEVLLRAYELNDEARGGKGKVAKAAGIPQRQFVMYQEDDIDDIQEIFYEWLVEKTIEFGKFRR